MYVPALFISGNVLHTEIYVAKETRGTAEMTGVTTGAESKLFIISNLPAVSDLQARLKKQFGEGTELRKDSSDAKYALVSSNCLTEEGSGVVCACTRDVSSYVVHTSRSRRCSNAASRR